VGSHPSRLAAGPLGPAAYLELGGQRHRSCLALHRAGFAWPPRRRDAGALLPHHFTLAGTKLTCGFALRRCVSVALSRGFPRVGLPTTLPCGVRTFLEGTVFSPSSPRLPGRPLNGRRPEAARRQAHTRGRAAEPPVEEFASRAKEPPPTGPLEELTERAREVMALVAGGLSNEEIAERLVVSPATAKTHVSGPMVKLAARGLPPTQPHPPAGLPERSPLRRDPPGRSRPRRSDAPRRRSRASTRRRRTRGCPGRAPAR
jgi:Bacterial regulatory proteins, luxR family